MNSPDAQEEPLKNIALESAILGLKMALTPEEEAETRKSFLDQLRVSTLVVPTVQPVPTLPDGSVVPNTNITFVVVEAEDQVTGVPAFTTVAGLRATLPNVENGMFMNGTQLAGILAPSPHLLYVQGPDMHAAVEKDELTAIAETAQLEMEAQQAAAQHNQPLEAALADLKENDSATTREAATNAFVNGFCRIPIAMDSDVGVNVIMLQTGGPQDIPLITDDDGILCFTGDDAIKAWQDVQRSFVALPGALVADLVLKTGLPGIIINRGTDTSASLRVEQNRVVVA